MTKINSTIEKLSAERLRNGISESRKMKLVKHYWRFGSDFSPAKNGSLPRSVESRFFNVVIPAFAFS